MEVRGRAGGEKSACVSQQLRVGSRVRHEVGGVRGSAARQHDPK